MVGEIHFLFFHVTITTTLIATPRQLCGIHFVRLERGCSGMIFFCLRWVLWVYGMKYKIFLIRNGGESGSVGGL